MKECLHDAAGNLLGDGANTYTYDVENRVTTVGSAPAARFTYDAFGNRVGHNFGYQACRISLRLGRTPD